MFTGLIEEIGEIVRVTAGPEVVRFAVRAPEVAATASLGDSIATDGVCLTVVAVAPGGVDTDYEVEAMPQTLRVTTAGEWSPGSAVNLERALRADARLGGHIVQGHVEQTAEVLTVTEHPDWRVVRIALPAEAAPLVVDKGSICVNGVSLTVSAVSAAGEAAAWFEVSLIPATIAATTLGAAVIGTRVNLETDILARHVARLAEFAGASR
ncbi:riboflavin synthase [Microbacterium nymphoidis]|uniref:riboflavin synthase n=1 Tax=Microbacterium nymphoidis TaxID=2898586 RepID=UPI001E2CA27E|nr:riboflavin synthase [Microbacterium nymphoidis]MCD2497591.1 riboflavin synthase [Microbacterium nymphoidis]